jgi:hypothetical protein
VHGHLADVVQQRRPAKSIAIDGRESEFIGNQIGEQTDPLGVAPGATVVPAERGREREDLDCGGIWLS